MGAPSLGVAPGYPRIAPRASLGSTIDAAGPARRGSWSPYLWLDAFRWHCQISPEISLPNRWAHAHQNNRSGRAQQAKRP